MADLPPIKIIRSSRKTLALHMLADGTIEVKAPLFILKRQINGFIEKHRDWIEERLKKIQESPRRFSHTYEKGDQFLYLGTKHTLHLGDFSAIQATTLTIQFPQFLQFRAQKELTTWFIAQAKEVITRRVEYYATDMKTTYQSISFADTKSRWGACTHDNHLQFNWRLIMSPLLVINYVVVHELAHTKEKNHSQAFWRIVRYYCPSYRQHIKWLKENGDTLFI